MNPHLMQKLNGITDAFSIFLLWLQNSPVILSLLAGLTLPFIFNLPREERKNAPFWLKSVACVSIFFFIFGTMSPLSIHGLSYLFDVLDPNTLLRIPLWIITILFTLAGLAFHLTARRLLAGEIDSLKHRMIKKSKLERNTRTDVRKVKELLPDSIEYNPLDYIDLKKGVFIGLDKDDQPQYITIKEFQKQHAAIIGTTGSGKGITASILLYQAILLGEAVFVEDPKDDEWAVHVLREACKKAGKKFVVINLNRTNHQLDLLADISHEQLEELFNAGFSLSKKGEAADFYRIADRRAARNVAAIHKTGMTLYDLFNDDNVKSIGEDAPAFLGELEEIALVNSVNAKNGFSLKEIFDNGGCCYIIGSTRNQKIISAQRMILTRLIQIAETRDRINTTPRVVAIFLDELKYHISRPTMEGLGTARDKSVHIFMAFQAIDDLRDCPSDLNGDSVIGAVIENAKFKLIYKIQNPETAEWAAKMTGSILVDDEMRKVRTDLSLTEKVDTDRMIRQAESYYVDSNMFLNLPERVGFVFTSKDLPKATKMSHIPANKETIELLSFETEQIEQHNNNDVPSSGL
ncbi:TPA: type IV secretory system conjugative DNA transfer family protein [Salmonella enterica]|uniref:Type IV secretory system conjugative DNA transfer family protein n=1 Tax=Salmonella enterica TaxID=28901 RepID=A0A761QME3_SALER|nr:type IV secretory system conjugative DNA transfer family protein [Salmonella enterica]HDJ1973565.1 type IV secretory system conjugative DNA transfer family protein [Salmonella enterica subsp. enterica]HAG5567559.1 type IV secretory system conjugative DNA transfer family protein [Salmonella enterica]HAK0560188.1 type IV secretory system conjugative DNA transfer family protein [Salmonella enterica]HAK0609849.1 type IV secretory system conjugative DNA transfer family protein [Salmonella enteric